MHEVDPVAALWSLFLFLLEVKTVMRNVCFSPAASHTHFGLAADVELTAECQAVHVGVGGTSEASGDFLHSDLVDSVE